LDKQNNARKVKKDGDLETNTNQNERGSYIMLQFVIMKLI